ncbi:MAG: 30S ribosomal protein S13 [Candidatus Diapherotrites archaeon]|nr:30S ribosomal protein S13 [Candidatus Diapherotrites archaeon]
MSSKKEKEAEKKMEKPNLNETSTQSKAKESSLRYIVRFCSVDLDGNKPIYQALTKIKGIGRNLAMIFAKEFERIEGIKFDEKIGKLSDEQLSKLESIVTNPEKINLPEWCLNRRKNFYNASSEQKIMGDLDFAVREDLKRLNIIKSYRGLRLAWGLTVRGQRTKSTHRGKGSIVGVIKKEVKAASAPKKGESKEK